MSGRVEAIWTKRSKGGVMDAAQSVDALEGILEVLEHCDVETIEEEIMPCVLKLLEVGNRI